MALGSTGDITIWIESTEKDLANLQITPQTAYVWTNGARYRLVPQSQELGYKGRSSQKTKDGKTKSVGFYLVLEPYEGRKDNKAVSFESGIYNISIQFNGEAGIHTLSGSFTIKS